MLDIHSHILPGMDDGSRSVEESLAMLAALSGQGIGTVAATSHFYPSENSPAEYLARRSAALRNLLAAMPEGGTRILPGAEVYYFDGISRNDQTPLLRLEGTPLLLLEMPFSPWPERMIREVESLNRRPGIRVLLAHIERYFPFQRAAVWDGLLAHGVLMQSNADFFLSRRTRRRAMRMLKEGRIHLIGSDCHNMEERRPRLGEALAAVGEEGKRILERNIRMAAPELAEEEQE